MRLVALSGLETTIKFSIIFTQRAHHTTPQKGDDYADFAMNESDHIIPIPSMSVKQRKTGKRCPASWTGHQFGL